MILQVGHSSYGSDPELFLEKGGVIVGSERVIPKKGILIGNWGYGSIVRDGVQMELHPNAVIGVTNATGSLVSVFKNLKDHLEKYPDFKACFTQVVEVSKEELESLSHDASALGCQESFNIYGLKKLDVDGSKYRKRSAGGHIHLGLGNPIYVVGRHVKRGERKDERKRLIPILDYIVGNTCVLLDRDPNQVERRKLYGRAGEYRLPRYGVEYRTLSNFWLRSVELAQLVFGLAEMSVGILGTTLSNREDLEKELMTSVDPRQVVKAIQKNDAGMAMENWVVIREFIRKHALGTHVINSMNLAKFDRFLSVVVEKGLDVFFPEDPITNWSKRPNKLSGGEWRTFLESIQLPEASKVS